MLRSLLIISVLVAKLSPAFAAPGSLELEVRAPPTCSYVAKNPAPSSYTCGQQGKLSSPAVILTSNVATLQACTNSCLNNQPTCKAFSYGPKKTCTTYSKGISSSGFTQQNTGKTFWSEFCFKKVCSCPAGQKLCSNNCVNTLTNNNNCGTCGAVCPGQTTCNSGTCGCPSGLTKCGDPASPTCVNTNTDNSNCGSCGTTCSTTCSNGTCSPPDIDSCSDPYNCNGAGNGTGCTGDALCICADRDGSTTNGGCAEIVGSCGAFEACTSSAGCTSSPGGFCALNMCCPNGICMYPNTSVCYASTPSRIFKKSRSADASKEGREGQVLTPLGWVDASSL